MQVRHGTPDARLLAEITLAGGFTSFEGGGISYNIPYAKNVPLARSIADWKYVDRLCGMYEENGVSINREPFGPLTGTLVPPCIGIAVGILEGLLALEQGVRSLTLGYGQGGNMAQDIAAIARLRELAARVFPRGRLRRATTSRSCSTSGWAGFPRTSRGRSPSSAGAPRWRCLGGADKVIVKTPHEAMGIPTKEANAQGLRATRQVINMLADQETIETPDIAREKEIIRREVRLHPRPAPSSSAAATPPRAPSAAFEAGVLDVPFAPSSTTGARSCPCATTRAASGSSTRGALPLDAETCRLPPRARCEQRSRTEGRKRLVPDGDRRHLRDQQGTAGGEAAMREDP